MSQEPIGFWDNFVLRLGMLQFQKRNETIISKQVHPQAFLNTLLLSRGIDSVEEVERFFHPKLSDLLDPFLFRDMRIAVNILQNAIAKKQKIAVFGDYDCDGVCASTILCKAIKVAGGKVFYTVPSREEGYGLNKAAILALSKEYSVLVTVDLGISNLDEIAYAKSLGLKVIVSDHHQLPDTLPSADAIIHPHLEPYPFPFLCGGAVAFKIALALIGERAFDFLDFAAISTVGDIVALKGENRVIVRHGLERIKQTKNLGLRILCNLAGLDKNPQISSEDVAFRIVPRINAAGRIDSAKIAIDLFQTEEEKDAQELAERLEAFNQSRKQLETQILEEALAQVEQLDFSKQKFIVVQGEAWHHGVIGLVAGKICERYHLPVAAFTVDEEKATASVRSIPGVNVYYFLKKCSDLFSKWGGHEQAAGLTLKKENLSIFTERINEYIQCEVPSTSFISKQVYDSEIQLSEVTLENIEILELFQPCGEGNPAPLFLAKGVEVCSARAVGSNASHLKIAFQEEESIRDGIAFGKGNLYSSLGSNMDCVFSIERNIFLGQTKAQLMIRALKNTFQGEVEKIKAISSDILDSSAMEFYCNALEKYKKNTVDFVASVDFVKRDIYGTLVLSYNKDNALAFYEECVDQFDIFLHSPEEKNGQNAIVLAPNWETIPQKYTNILLLDGAFCEEQIAFVQEIFPNARVSLAKNNQISLEKNLLYTNLEEYREIYKALYKHNNFVLNEICASLHLKRETILYAIFVFQSVGLLEFKPFTQRITLVKNPPKSDIENCLLVKLLRE